MSIEATGNKIVDLHPSSGGGGGSSNYNELTNRPQINSVTLAGNKTGAQLGLQDKLQEDAQRTIVIAGNVISVNGTLYYTKEQVDAKFTGVAKTYIVEALPATPDANTYYLVGNDTDGYTLYYYDDNLRQAVIGSYELDLTIYAKKEQKIGSRQFQGDITVANLFDDLKDYTGTIKNKTIDADDNTIQDLTTTNFKDGVVLTAIPSSGATDTTIATVKAIKTEIDKKQDKITTTNQEADPTDTDNLSDLSGTTNKRWTFAKIWNWIKGKLNLDLFASAALTASRVLYTDSEKKLATSTITPTKLGYLANVTSDIQTQINAIKYSKTNSVIKIGNGLEIHIETSVTVGSSGTQTKNFATAFPNACWTILASPAQPGYGANAVPHCKVTSKSQYQVSQAGGVANMGINIIAIGY